MDDHPGNSRTATCWSDSYNKDGLGECHSLTAMLLGISGAAGIDEVEMAIDGEAMTSQVRTLLHLSRDLIQHILLFLDYQTMMNFAFSSKLSEIVCPKRLWQRACSHRWKYVPIDRGTGIGLQFTLDRSDWRQAALARESIESCLAMTTDPSDMIAIVAKVIAGHLTSVNVFEEGLRWIVEIFDRFGEELSGRAAITKESLRRIVFMMSRTNRIKSCQHLGLKAFGIIALNETSRKVLPSLGALVVLLNAVKSNRDDHNLVENALWSLVIIGRPLGSSEGTRFPYQRDESIAHVYEFLANPQLGIVEMVVGTVRCNMDRPSVLSKAFWSIVNLSLLDANKEMLVGMRIVHMIVESMKRYPSHRELQFRSCFALINLSLHRDSRNLIRTLDGIGAVLSAMKRFPDFAMLQRCACNVLVSLAWSSRHNRDIMTQSDAMKLVSIAMRRYIDFKDIGEIGETFMILMNGHEYN